ncbi:UNVERIFIED_CONTAM: hypothetical protein Slati_1920900 [Sesamum latifolium]|uniref:Reverse transcriptase domain-containing protein n=1 Tax=Sesamum latifolium TaxID=2727402 RepID=A0AAW2X6M3_9LAMI
MKENKDEGPFKKPKTNFKDKKPAWQKVNMAYTPLTVPITQALMAVEGKDLLSRPRHLKSEIERLIQNGYLQEYIYWEKATGGPAGGDSQRARKAHVREAYGMSTQAARPIYTLERLMIKCSWGMSPSRRQTLPCTASQERGKKRGLEETPGEENSNKRGKDQIPSPEPKEEAPVMVQPVEELLTVELTPGDSKNVTKIGSKMTEDVRDQVVNCLRKNKDIFAWTPQDLEGIDPGVITHHLNLDPSIRL